MMSLNLLYAFGSNKNEKLTFKNKNTNLCWGIFLKKKKENHPDFLFGCGLGILGYIKLVVIKLLSLLPV